MWQAREILETITSRDTTPRSATETIRYQQHDAASIATLVPRYLHALTLSTHARHERAAVAALGPALAAALTADPAWPAASRALLHAETAGWQPERILAAAARRGPLGHTDQPAELLAWRITDITKTVSPPAHLHQPTDEDAERYATITVIVTGFTAETPSVQETPACLTAPFARTAADRHPRIPAAALDRYAAQAAAALGTTPDNVTRHRAWPRLAGILAATDHDGRDPAALVDHASVAAVAEPDPVACLTRTAARLADSHGTEPMMPSVWRHLADLAAVTGMTIAEQARQEPAWPALASALDRATHAGHDPRDLLTFGRRPARSRPGTACIRIPRPAHRPAPRHQPGPRR
jgi:hypothetical protein